MTRALVRHIRARKRFADDAVAGRLADRRLRIDLQRKAAIANESPDADTGAAGERTDLAIDDCQFRGGTTEPRRPEREQRLSGGGGRLTHFDAAAGQPRASAGAALVRAYAGIAIHDCNALGLNAEFLGRHLRHRDPQTGADINFARVQGHRAVGMNREETVDLAGIERLAGVAASGRRLRPRPSRQRRVERKAHDQGSAGFQEIATRQYRCNHRCLLCS